mmetsp:Transcript_110991/g.264818  ORF Transcript_110991/g.264818 Transcript_110991/m.264818 type:complete len:205 (-) Transcript_110991:2373-2987(-)
MVGAVGIDQVAFGVHGATQRIAEVAKGHTSGLVVEGFRLAVTYHCLDLRLRQLFDDQTCAAGRQHLDHFLFQKVASWESNARAQHVPQAKLLTAHQVQALLQVRSADCVLGAHDALRHVDAIRVPGQTAGWNPWAHEQVQGLSTVNLNRQVYLALAEGRDGAVNSVYVEGLALAVENAGLAVAQKLWIAATGTFDHEASTSLVV